MWFAPAIALLLLVTLYPTAYLFWVSFHKTRFFAIQGFVGLDNYIAVLTSQTFLDTSIVSLTYVVGSLAVVLPLGLAAALTFNGAGRLAPVLRVIGLLPWTLSMAVVGSIWLWMLNPSFGPILYLLRSLGLSAGLMLGDPGLAPLLLIGVTAWWSFPYVMVLMAAALKAVPRDLYEAADIDGARVVAKFRFITLPHLLPTLGSAALTLGILYLTLVTLIIVMTGGGPLGSTTTWSFDIFRETVQATNIAPAATASVIVLAANVALGLLYVRATGRVSA
jgi:multiple sugar transport system permease protein